MLALKIIFSDKYKNYFVQTNENLVDIFGKLSNLCYTCKNSQKLAASNHIKQNAKKTGSKNPEHFLVVYILVKICFVLWKFFYSLVKLVQRGDFFGTGKSIKSQFLSR